MNRFSGLLSTSPRLVRWVLLWGMTSLLGLSALRLAVVAVFGRGSVSPGDWAGVFWLGVRFDARVTAGILFPLLVFGSLAALHPFERSRARRFWVGYLSIASLALAVVYLCDLLHLHYLNQRLNASVLSFLTDWGISLHMIWQSYPVVWGCLALLVAGVIVTWVARRSHRASETLREHSHPYASVGWRVGAGCVLIFALHGRFGQYPLRWSDAFDLRNDLHANLALNPVQSFFSSLSFRSSRFDLKQVDLHREQMAEYLHAQGSLAGGSYFSRRLTGRERLAWRPRNVVLVICESFSGYKSSMWGNPLDTTPYFAELCRQGVFFDRCFTPHFGTARGVWATLTGVPDVELVKTATRNPALVDQHTLLNEMEGLAKLYFIGGSTSWANLRGLLTNNIRGLQLFEEGSFQSPRADVWGISDKDLFLEAHEILKRQTQPFFAVIQTANNHRPYTIPDEDRRHISTAPVSEEVLKANGFESQEELDTFRYTDYTFKVFIEAARASPYFDDTLFVFIGDHGIGGNAGTRFPEAWTDKSLTSFHVPLLFYAPGHLPARRIHSVASMIDVLPTITGLMGLSPRYSALGRDLLEQEAKDGGRSNTAFIIDHNNKSIGVVRGSHYTSRRLNESTFQSSWAQIEGPAGKGLDGTALAEEGRWAEAWFETSRYLLHTNKKFAPAP